MNWGAKEITIVSVIGIILLFFIYNLVADKKETKSCPTCPSEKPCIKPNLSPVYTLSGPLPTTETLLTRSCDDTRKIILRDAYPMGTSFVTNTVNANPIRPMCANMYTENADIEYKKEKTDWIFALYDDNFVKMVVVTLVLKNGGIYVYSRKGKWNRKAMPDLTSNYGIIGSYFEVTNDTNDGLNPPSVVTLSTSPSTTGYGLQNLTYSIYNKVRPRIRDQGYLDMPRGWFDIDGTGEATYYCRDVGPATDITGNNQRWISCVKENGTPFGTAVYENPVVTKNTPGSNQGDYIISGPDISTRAQYTGKTPINLDTKYKASLY